MRFAILLVLCLPISAQAAFFAGCLDTYRHFTGTRTEPLLDGKVTLIIFPGHVKVAVDGIVYNSEGGYRPMGLPLWALLEEGRSGKSIFTVVNIRVTQSELDRMNAFVGKPALRAQSCVSGSCKAINWQTGFSIPPPARWVPELAVTYLSLIARAKLDHGRIESVVDFGTKKQLALTRVLLMASYAAVGASIMLPPLFNDDDAKRKNHRSSIRDESDTEKSLTAVSMQVVQHKPSRPDGYTPIRLEIEASDGVRFQEDGAVFYETTENREGPHRRMRFLEKDSLVYAEATFIGDRASVRIPIGRVDQGKLVPSPTLTVVPSHIQKPASRLAWLNGEHAQDFHHLKMGIRGLDGFLSQ